MKILVKGESTTDLLICPHFNKHVEYIEQDLDLDTQFEVPTIVCDRCNEHLENAYDGWEADCE